MGFEKSYNKSDQTCYLQGKSLTNQSCSKSPASAVETYVRIPNRSFLKSFPMSNYFILLPLGQILQKIIQLLFEFEQIQVWNFFFFSLFWGGGETFVCCSFIPGDVCLWLTSLSLFQTGEAGSLLPQEGVLAVSIPDFGSTKGLHHSSEAHSMLCWCITALFSKLYDEGSYSCDDRQREYKEQFPT